MGYALETEFSQIIEGGPAAIAPALERITGWLETVGAGEAARFRLTLALDELITNVFEHGRPSDDAVSVALKVLPGDRTVLCELRDSGPAFDPFQAPLPDLEASLEDRPIGGLGVHILRQWIPEFGYRRETGHNVVELRIPFDLGRETDNRP